MPRPAGTVGRAGGVAQITAFFQRRVAAPQDGAALPGVAHPPASSPLATADPMPRQKRARQEGALLPHAAAEAPPRPAPPSQAVPLSLVEGSGEREAGGAPAAPAAPGSHRLETSESAETALPGAGPGQGPPLSLPREPAGPEDDAYPPLWSLLRDATWRDALAGEFQKPYVARLQQFLWREARAGQQVFPPPGLVFNALNSCPLSAVRLVIIGQDPYHGPGQAMGLSFSVPRGVPPPSSLVNIFKELKQDLGCPMPGHGDLSSWAKQGVLLLNTVLTVRKGQANSHAKQGWETLTDATIRALVAHHTRHPSSSSRQPGSPGTPAQPNPGTGSAGGSTGRDAGDTPMAAEAAKRLRREGLGSSDKPGPVVFLLWGNHAQTKAKLLPQHSAIHVLKAPHPSGLSAHRGFFGCRHFSMANTVFTQNEADPINWSTCSS